MRLILYWCQFVISNVDLRIAGFPLRFVIETAWYMETCGGYFLM